MTTHSMTTHPMTTHGMASIACPVCRTENDPLALTCASCKAFIRDRVPALNLFACAYGLIERPAETFLRIARSEQKNYTLTLFAFAGPALIAAVFAVARIGDADVHFGLVLIALFAGGLPAGVAVYAPAAWLLTRLLRRPARARLRFRDGAVLAAYSLLPVVFASVVLLPVQLAVWGGYLFSVNPSPLQLKPAAFWALAALDAGAVIWSAVLLLKAYRPHHVSPLRTAAALALPVGMIACAVWFGGRALAALTATP